ncbi:MULTISPECIES: adenosine kinase [unclassified Prochlorococcus]|uniref:adenosine kinase n=1 Tax=unclassified Prochlorococcus TaxID=2627481 RepID=UPI000533B265|nr:MULTISPECIES: adenosine kinase [unclassified Prochlorococcus]KGG16454.1 Frucktokinase [Prochlorococcus sp. MIT 0602]KGG17072.1 Fructokinase [Prochlorococcus sp. MIT 0603]
MNINNIDVVAIGNAIVDVLINIDDSFLYENSLLKGSMTLIDQNKAQKLYLKSKSKLQSSGGSAANTIAGLAELGCSTNFIGRVQDDQLGEIFKEDISSTGAIFNSPTVKGDEPTGRCFIYITPDAERTMCTFLGCSNSLKRNDIDLSIVKKAKVLYLEGYLWDLNSAKDAFKTSAEVCRNYGGKIALSLSDIFCIERHRDSFQELLENYIDIIFANEIEIISLYKSSTLQSAIEKIKDKCEIAVITRGEKGSIIISAGRVHTIKSHNFGKAIDTTGAGDLYASGFLYGYIHNKNLTTCGEIGSICAGQIVTQLGSRSKTSLRSLVNKKLNHSTY